MEVREGDVIASFIFSRLFSTTHPLSFPSSPDSFTRSLVKCNPSDSSGNQFRPSYHELLNVDRFCHVASRPSFFFSPSYSRNRIKRETIIPRWTISPITFIKFLIFFVGMIVDNVEREREKEEGEVCIWKRKGRV